MKNIKLYTYKNCQTCKKATKLLDGLKISFKEIPIEITPPTNKELKLALEQNGGQLKKLFNTSGQLYREMGLSKKLQDISEDKALELLQEHGMLVKRPFLCINSEQTALGFKEDVWRTLIK